MLNKFKLIIANSKIINLLKVPIIFFWLFKIKNNRILCSNFMGKGFGDSPKSIVEKLLNNKYEIIWMYNGEKIELPSGVKSVKMYSLKYFYYIATSKFWVFNTRTPSYFLKRKKQYYIQTWHGCLAFKKIEFDVENKLNKNYIHNAYRDTKITDLMISNSDFCTEMYKRAFKYNGNILCYGTPRNDIFINGNMSSLKKKVFNSLGIDNNHKLILYAPTFRVNYDNNPYDIDLEMISCKLEKKYGSKFDVAVRMHPGIKNPDVLIEKYSGLINCNSYDDIQELICACDLLITDYSSTMFEAMIANKPVLIYANDIVEYNKDRGSYFSFDELPFTVCTNNIELKSILESIDLKKMCSSYKLFKENIKLVETGNSSLMVKEYIEKRMIS